MACVPFGVHAAQKVRHNMNLAKELAKDHEKPTTYSNSSNNNYGKKWYNDLGNSYKPKTSTMSDQPPAKYSDKMMNSIWGLYNRYSVHNFKSSTSSHADAQVMFQPSPTGNNKE